MARALPKNCGAVKRSCFISGDVHTRRLHERLSVRQAMLTHYGKYRASSNAPSNTFNTLMACEERSRFALRMVAILIADLRERTPHVSLFQKFLKQISTSLRAYRQRCNYKYRAANVPLIGPDHFGNVRIRSAMSSSDRTRACLESSRPRANVHRSCRSGTQRRDMEGNNDVFSRNRIDWGLQSFVRSHFR